MQLKVLRKTRLLLFVSIIILYGFSTRVFAQTTTATVTPTQITNPTILTPTPTVTMEETIVTTIPAQEVPTPTPTSKAEVLSAVVSIGTQSPWNKKIPLKLSIRPTVSGEKLTIRWQAKAGLVATPTAVIINSPQAGQVYTASFSMTPYSIGYQRAVADVILTTKTTNIVVSKDVSLQLSNDKVVIPITSAYIFYKVVMYLSIVITFFVIIPFGLYKTYMYIKTHVFPKWLESRIQVPR